MAETTTGNCLFLQSGRPCVVSNAILQGVISEALNHECIEEVYGVVGGLPGLLNEQLVDLAEESQQAIRGLRHTPGAALGSSLVRLRPSTDMDRVLAVLKAHDIRFLCITGGTEDMAMAASLAEAVQAAGMDVRVVGIPQAVDNAVARTDHSPGYGSMAKYLATMVREIATDCQSLARHDTVSIIEVTGRSNGWLPAAASLAKRRDHPNDPPHLLYLPHLPFDPNKFLDDVARVLKSENFCLIVVGEGLIDENGNYISFTGDQDPYTTRQQSGSGDYLKNLVEQHMSGISARCARLDLAPRAAIHCASETDMREAILAGEAAVIAACEGHNGRMVTLVRGETDHYSCETGLASLSEVASTSKIMPENWVNEDHLSMSFQFNKYALPLIDGEAPIQTDQGLPVFSALKRIRVPRKLSGRDA